MVNGKDDLSSISALSFINSKVFLGLQGKSWRDFQSTSNSKRC